MSKSNSSSGMSVFTVIGIVFIVLKLVGVINWSWWLVTLPFWGGLVLIVSVLVIIGIITYLIKK